MLGREGGGREVVLTFAYLKETFLVVNFVLSGANSCMFSSSRKISFGFLLLFLLLTNVALFLRYLYIHDDMSMRTGVVAASSKAQTSSQS